MQLVETGEDHVATEDFQSLLRLVYGLLQAVPLVHGTVHELRRKAKVDEMEWHLRKDVALQVSVREPFLKVR